MEYSTLYCISLVGESDDDDAAALIEAINRDSFIISCDMYQTYIDAGLTDEDWLEKHRIPCTWKKKFSNKDRSSSDSAASAPCQIKTKEK
jgi:hypothetical protein